MAALTTVALSRAGVPDSGGTAAGAGGDTFVNDGVTMLLVKNGSGASINVTFAYGQTVDGQTVPGKVVAVGAGVTTLIGPFPSNLFTDSNGNVAVSYSAVTSVTVKPIKFVNN